MADEPPVVGLAVGRDATPAAHAPMSMAGPVASLPNGAVTFLFSDIEGSTRLVKALRERYAQVLADHRRLVRAAIASHAGHEVDTQGDAFFVAFASAKQAVLCALAVQRALAGHQWPSGVSVRVRVGIHTGQATPVEGVYTGLAVHRAARICAAARGGQILISQATQTLIEDEEEELAFELVELGERRLKDLDRPVRLFELTVVEAVPEPPPQRSVPALALPSIVGRAAELRIISTAYARAGHIGYELSAGTDPGVLADQIKALMSSGHSQTIALGGAGGTLVLNGATLPFAVTGPNSLGGATPHG